MGFGRMVWRDETVSKHSAQQLLCSKLPQLFKKKTLVFTIRYIFLGQNNLGTVFLFVGRGGGGLVCSYSVSKNPMYYITRWIDVYYETLAGRYH